MFSIGHHFRAKANVLLTVALAPLVLGIAIAAVWPQVETWLVVDRCLDAGGKFDYAANSCLHVEQRPLQ